MDVNRSKIETGQRKGPYLQRKKEDSIKQKSRHKLKKVWKNTRPFRCDLNQIHYDYSVEVTNTFKGLDLTDKVPEELWMEAHNIA